MLNEKETIRKWIKEQSGRIHQFARWYGKEGYRWKDIMEKEF